MCIDAQETPGRCRAFFMHRRIRAARSGYPAAIDRQVLERV